MIFSLEKSTTVFVSTALGVMYRRLHRTSDPVGQHDQSSISPLLMALNWIYERKDEIYVEYLDLSVKKVEDREFDRVTPWQLAPQTLLLFRPIHPARPCLKSQGIPYDSTSRNFHMLFTSLWMRFVHALFFIGLIEIISLFQIFLRSDPVLDHSLLMILG